MKEMTYQKRGRIMEVLASGVYQDYKYAILNLGSHPTAYVEDKLNCKGYEDERLDFIVVHYGFTYHGEAYWNKEDRTLYLGWDYAHCNDYLACYEDTILSSNKRWTSEEIFEEVKRVIKQLKELEL